MQKRTAFLRRVNRRIVDFVFCFKMERQQARFFRCTRSGKVHTLMKTKIMPGISQLLYGGVARSVRAPINY